MSDFIQDGTGTGFRAKVDEKNRVSAAAISTTAATDAAIEGDLYNVNTGTLTLTDDSETGLLYLKNDEVASNIFITRSFYNLGASTGGSGNIFINLIRNPTAGTLITGGTANPPVNLDFGSSKVLNVTSLRGGTGSTVTDGVNALETLSAAAGTRILIGIDSLVLPPGSSIAIVITPQSGNTNMQINAGFNLYRRNI